MKFLHIAAVTLPVVAFATTADAGDACAATCNRWGQDFDCAPNCPPCRTVSHKGKTAYNCWTYLPGTDRCPQWSGIVDCGKSGGAPAPTVPTAKPSTTPAPAPNNGQPPASTPAPVAQGFSGAAPAPVQSGLTIYNRCSGGYKVYKDQHLVPERCLNGNYCQDYLGTNPAFHVRKDGDSLELGKTLVELFIPRGADTWYDISKIAGFNVGAEIKYEVGGKSSHTNTCTNVNCPDAYWLCDIAVTNLFSPVYNGRFGGGYTITFCPQSSDSQPLSPPAQGVLRQQNANAGPFTCRVKLFNKNIQLPGTIVDGGSIE